MQRRTSIAICIVIVLFGGSLDWRASPCSAYSSLFEMTVFHWQGNGIEVFHKMNSLQWNYLERPRLMSRKSNPPIQVVFPDRLCLHEFQWHMDFSPKEKWSFSEGWFSKQGSFSRWGISREVSLYSWLVEKYRLRMCLSVTRGLGRFWREYRARQHMNTKNIPVLHSSVIRVHGMCMWLWDQSFNLLGLEIMR